MSVQVNADLVSIDEKLRDYEAAWDAYVDAWLVVKVGTPEWVQRWRLQAEHAMRDSGKPGMTDEQVPHALTIACPSHHVSKSSGCRAVMRVEGRQTLECQLYSGTSTISYNDVEAFLWHSVGPDSTGGQLCGLLHASLQGLLARTVQQGPDDCQSRPAADAGNR